MFDMRYLCLISVISLSKYAKIFAELAKMNRRVILGEV